MSKRTSPQDSTVLSVYWFATMVDALETGDTIMATEACEKLRGFGFEVLATPRRRHRSS